MLILETLLRVFVGRTKPVIFAHAPPGAIGNQIVLPLAVLMLGPAIWTGLREIKKCPLSA